MSTNMEAVVLGGVPRRGFHRHGEWARSRQEWECKAEQWHHLTLYTEILQRYGTKGANRGRSNGQGLLVQFGATDILAFGSAQSPRKCQILPHPRCRIQQVAAS